MTRGSLIKTTQRYWTHLRRSFLDALEVNPQDAAVVKVLLRMDASFLDHYGRRRELSGCPKR